MNKSLHLHSLPALALALACLAAPPHPARAQAAPGAETFGSGMVESARELLVQSASASRPDAVRIEVQLGQLDPRLKLAACQRVEPYLPAGSPPMGHTRVGLRCLEGAVHWNVTLPVTVSVFAPGVVLRQTLPAGTVLDERHVAMADIDWGATGGRAHADLASVLGRELARPLAAGATLASGDLRQRQWFATGETVQLLARGRGFTVQSEGVALNAGVEGQSVRVRTSSGAIVSGRPSGAHHVEVAL